MKFEGKAQFNSEQTIRNIDKPMKGIGPERGKILEKAERELRPNQTRTGKPPEKIVQKEGRKPHKEIEEESQSLDSAPENRLNPLEQHELDKSLIMQFFGRLRLRLNSAGQPNLKIWVRTNNELYLTKAIYEHPLVRLGHWPGKLLGIADIPFIARTNSIYGITRSIEVGEPKALEEAIFTMRQLREHHPDFSVRLVTPDSMPFDDISNNQ